MIWNFDKYLDTIKREMEGVADSVAEELVAKGFTVEEVEEAEEVIVSWVAQVWFDWSDYHYEDFSEVIDKVLSDTAWAEALHKVKERKIEKVENEMGNSLKYPEGSIWEGKDPYLGSDDIDDIISELESENKPLSNWNIEVAIKRKYQSKIENDQR